PRVAHHPLARFEDDARLVALGCCADDLAARFSVGDHERDGERGDELALAVLARDAEQRALDLPTSSTVERGDRANPRLLPRLEHERLAGELALGVRELPDDPNNLVGMRGHLLARLRPPHDVRRIDGTAVLTGVAPGDAAHAVLDVATLSAFGVGRVARRV